MGENEIAELALRCFDGDDEKALALLQLLKISLQLDCDMPKVEMVLTEESTCCWEKEGMCWKDVPDSIRKCEKPCTFLQNKL